MKEYLDKGNIKSKRLGMGAVGLGCSGKRKEDSVSGPGRERKGESE